MYIYVLNLQMLSSYKIVKTSYVWSRVHVFIERQNDHWMFLYNIFSLWCWHITLLKLIVKRSFLYNSYLYLYSIINDMSIVCMRIVCTVLATRSKFSASFPFNKASYHWWFDSNTLIDLTFSCALMHHCFFIHLLIE